MDEVIARAVVAVALAGCLAEPHAHDGGASGIHFVAPFIQYQLPPNNYSVDMDLRATAAGNAIVIQMANPYEATTTYAVTAPPTWTMTKIADTPFHATFVAVAPNTDAATFTFRANTSNVHVILGDELTGNDPTGGATTFTHYDNSGAGNCNIDLYAHAPSDLLWVACTTGGTALPATGVTTGAQTHGNTTAFRSPSQPPGTVEHILIPTDTGVGFEMSGVVIKAR